MLTSELKDNVIRLTQYVMSNLPVNKESWYFLKYYLITNKLFPFWCTIDGFKIITLYYEIYQQTQVN